MRIPLTRAGALLAGLLLAACGDAPEAGHGHDHDAHDAQAPHDEPAESGDDVLEIEPAMRRDLRLTTAPVERRRASAGSLALGELHASEEAQAEVGVPVAGRLVAVLAAPGDSVRAGQPLAELESPELARAWSDFLSADARLVLARAASGRTERLAADQLAPAREQEAATAELLSAEAARHAARVTLQALGVPDPGAVPPQDAGGRLVLAAPLDGTVLERDAVPGRFVAPGQRLFRVADLSVLWLVVHAGERDALRVRLGATAKVSLPALPGALQGRVTWIGSEVDEGSRTLPVRVEIANPDGRLRPGLSGSASLPLDEADAELLAVPSAALQRLGAGWCVFLPAGEGRFERRAVVRGRDLGGEVEVLDGLAEGETVVVEGAFLLRAEVERRRGGGDAHEH